MIKIKKGSYEFLVSKKTYEDVYKKIGYTIVNDKAEVAKKTTSAKEKETKYSKLIEEEKKENKIIYDEEEDVVTSEQLKKPIELNVEDNFGFEDKNNKEDIYLEKLNALKQSEKSKK